jgi:predicted negative regulator of RcsB-dependent stress response
MLNQQKQMQPDAEAVTKETEAAKEDVKAAAEKAEGEVKGAAEKVEGEVKATQSAFDAMVAEAKALIEGKKYQDALAKLQAGLAMPALSEEQKSILQKLIEQAKAALAGSTVQDAQKAAGNLLKGAGVNK